MNLLITKLTFFFFGGKNTKTTMTGSTSCQSRWAVYTPMWEVTYKIIIGPQWNFHWFSTWHSKGNFPSNRAGSINYSFNHITLAISKSSKQIGCTVVLDQFLANNNYDDHQRAYTCIANVSTLCKAKGGQRIRGPKGIFLQIEERTTTATYTLWWSSVTFLVLGPSCPLPAWLHTKWVHPVMPI